MVPEVPAVIEPQLTLVVVAELLDILVTEVLVVLRLVLDQLQPVLVAPPAAVAAVLTTQQEAAAVSGFLEKVHLVQLVQLTFQVRADPEETLEQMLVEPTVAAVEGQLALIQLVLQVPQAQ